MRYRDVVELALYDPEHGFYATGGRAGRRGDFLTSPEVGPLFGMVVSEAAHREWVRCGRPSPFSVVDAGAGPGTLIASVSRAVVAAAADSNWDVVPELVAVERAALQRESHPPGVRSVDSMPSGPIAGLIVANELLDNLPFTPLRRSGEKWREVLVDIGDGEHLVERLGDTISTGIDWIDDRAERVVLQEDAGSWLADALESLTGGRVLVIDYCRDRSGDVGIRTYARHGRGGDPLSNLGAQDITVDVDLAQLAAAVRSPDELTTQADWLARHGIDGLVDDGKAAWAERAHIGDLDALTARSRIREAEALTDPDGLGGFSVAEWAVG